MIHIACGCNDRYARHTAAMLISVAEHVSPEVNIKAYVLHDNGLSGESIQKLRASLPDTVEIETLFVSDELMDGLPTHKFHRECWHRIFLPELLPELDRVLYLDSDMIAVDDITTLWSTDIGSKLFGAVVNPLYPFNPPHPITKLGLDNLSDYLNAGCLLMDLSKMRQADFSYKTKCYGIKHPENTWPEQDAMSVVWQKQWFHLHPRWNMQSTFFDLHPQKLPVSTDIVAIARERPAVIHFIGTHKPWHYLCRNAFRQAYFDASKKTAWGESEVEGRTWLNILLRPFSLGIQLRVLRRIPRWLLMLLDR